MSASWSCSCEFWGALNHVLSSGAGLSSANQWGSYEPRPLSPESTKVKVSGQHMLNMK